MLETIAIVLLILWARALVSSYSMGGLIQLLLVVAAVMIPVVAILIRAVRRRRSRSAI